jgi:hypothetical protein
MQTKPKVIEGYNGRYTISPRGFVVDTWKKMIINPFVDEQGYKRVLLQQPDYKAEWWHFKIHRLVAENFLERVEGKNVVHHINHNKFDNHVSNVKWTTLKESLQSYKTYN